MKNRVTTTESSQKHLQNFNNITTILKAANESKPSKIEDCLVKGASIGMMSRNAPELITTTVVMYLIELVEFYNVKKGMNQKQIELTAELILEDFGHLTPFDLKLFTRKAMKGHFGKSYDRIDGSVIMEWLNDYNEQRCEVAGQISRNRSQIHKKMSNFVNPAMPEDFIKRIKDIKESIREVEKERFQIPEFEHWSEVCQSDQELVQVEKFVELYVDVRHKMNKAGVHVQDLTEFAHIMLTDAVNNKKDLFQFIKLKSEQYGIQL